MDQTQQQADPQAERGREADRPSDIPARGWKDVLWRAWKQSSEDNVGILAGGVTYGVLLALFPALAALVAIFGLLADPAVIQQQMSALSGMVPGDTEKLVSAELQRLTSHSGSTLGIGAAVGFVLALWSASRGMSGMVSALNSAYGEKERRGFVTFNLIALALTVGAIFGGLIGIGLIAGIPAMIGVIGLGKTARWLVLILEWPLLIVLMMVMLAVLYRFAPDRDAPKWRWVSPGAVTATLLWIIASVLFTVYVSHFGSYDATYGSLGAIIVLLTWLYLSAYLVLLGAEVNAQSERQTRKDTTAGPPEPMGEREARAADTLGPSYEQADSG